MRSLILRLGGDESGQDITEYALLLLLISLVAITSMKTIATAIERVFTTTATNLATT